ncbi:MAG: response regulator [Spirochaetota bacterium]
MTAHDDRKTILLVEDQAIIAMAEKEVLERNGFNVMLAHTGEKAVELVAADSEIDLVLMDINLGKGIDGSQAAEAILGVRDVPIVFLSAHTNPSIVRKTEGISSYGYIVKNSGDTVLLASIKMAFRLHEAKLAVKQNAGMLATMLRVSRELVATFDLQTILQAASDRLSEPAGLNAGAVYLLDGDEITLEATTPALPHDFPAEFRRALLADHPHIAKAVAEQSPVFVADTDREPFTDHERAISELRHLYSILYVPLVARGHSIGVYIAGATERRTDLPQSIIDLCGALANMAAIAVENALVLSRR